MLNGTGAILVALQAGMSIESISKSLKAFQGVGRRFTPLGSPGGVVCIDDYAHHPTEIKMALLGARSITKGRVVAVMQPHRYSRLSHFFNDFITCCQEADTVLITPVYGAGEDPLPLTHQELYEAMAQTRAPQSVYALKDQKDLFPLVQSLCQPGDTLIFMGAGSISSWAKEVVALWHEALECAPLKSVVNF